MRLAVALLALLVLAPAAAAAPNVEIRRTSHGIPHIKAKTFYGAAYGYGYAFAQDNLCEMAETYVTVNGERSRYFGPDGSYESRGNGATLNNLDSDFFFQRIKDDRVVEKLLEQPPPAGPLPEIREGARGYAAGYNAYLAEVGVDGIPDPRCRGKAWVRPITELDAFRRFYQLALLASSGVAIDGIAQAQPPTPATAASRPAPLPPLPTQGQLGTLRGPAAARRPRLQRRRARQGGDEGRQGAAARQPALPLGRARALLPGAAHDPRRGRRGRRLAVRRAADPDRPHAEPGLEPHGLDRVPLHAVRAQARARLAHDLPRRRAAARDAPPGRSRSRRARPTARWSRARGRCTRPSSARCSPSLLGLPLFPWTPDRRPTRWATRTRATSGCSTTSSRSTARSRRRSWTRSSAATRASRGSTRSPPTRAARPTTPTSARSRT